MKSELENLYFLHSVGLLLLPRALDFLKIVNKSRFYKHVFKFFVLHLTGTPGVRPLRLTRQLTCSAHTCLCLCMRSVYAGNHKFSSSVMSRFLWSMCGVLHRLDLGLTSHPNYANIHWLLNSFFLIFSCLCFLSFGQRSLITKKSRFKNCSDMIVLFGCEMKAISKVSKSV